MLAALSGDMCRAVLSFLDGPGAVSLTVINRAWLALRETESGCRVLSRCCFGTRRTMHEDQMFGFVRGETSERHRFEVLFGTWRQRFIGQPVNSFQLAD